MLWKYMRSNDPSVSQSFGAGYLLYNVRFDDISVIYMYNVTIHKYERSKEG